jgi:pyruvate,orthophosphate dikinase
MSRAAGILTSTGGFVSHAAVVARGWGIPAVVGASDVAIGEAGVTIGATVLAVGDTITIDGATGDVFAGSAAGVTQVVPEAATLLGWARELGIEIDEPAGGGELVASPCAEPLEGAMTMAITDDDVIRVLVIKGYGDGAAVGTAIGCSAEDAAAVIDRLVADGIAERGAGSFRLTAAGKAVGSEKIAEDTAAWGVNNAGAALDAFLVLDHRMKTTVTAWQMREVDGEQVFNDHSDAAYDAAVLADLAALHADAAAWLRPIALALPRLGAYLRRLQLAHDAAQAGDAKYVASPRVDSYHSAWFELHEDLILLAGRNRADEVAAGRA